MSQVSADHPRRFRYSLRGLMLLCALVAGVIGFLFHRLREEQRHVDAIVAAGGRVQFVQDLVSLAMRYGPTTHWWRRFGGLSKPVKATLTGKQITDEILINHLGHLTSLEWVHLVDTAATEEGLQALTRLRSLGSLSVRNEFVTDEVLEKQISRLTNLESLGLASAAVTDDGLRHLTRLKSLRDLGLVGVAVTDDGLRHLAPLKSLKLLYCFRDEKNAEVLPELYEETEIDTQEVPLEGLVEYLGDLHGPVAFKIDEPSLSAAGIDQDVPITCKVNSVTLAQALDAVLAPHGMAWLISEGGIVITSRQAASKNQQLVQDLRTALPALKDIWVDWVPEAAHEPGG